ncbi:hypothetical protein BD311DRAFT_771402 [Dichomitus squalens]|uniref:Uncharacterized protein n=1 Tax=Dichomitus squalens TaxID=114155 RepID=A0A4V2JYN8_9APHY|nr:hypothetical protein BD311DRAFT_771402 [Dichomitus squalens]
MSERCSCYRPLTVRTEKLLASSRRSACAQTIMRSSCIVIRSSWLGCSLFHFCSSL